jgi:hypothetical protein
MMASVTPDDVMLTRISPGSGGYDALVLNRLNVCR